MSERTKKHLTDEVRIEIGRKSKRLFIVPKSELSVLLKLIEGYEQTELIPWEEALKGFFAKTSKEATVLRGMRHTYEFTQVELAKKMGVAQNVISEMESGKRPIGKNMAKKLAAVFKVDYRFFL